MSRKVFILNFCWDQWSHKWYPYIKINKILSLPFATLERTLTKIFFFKIFPLREDDEHCHITCHGILKTFTIELEKKKGKIKMFAHKRNIDKRYSKIFFQDTAMYELFKRRHTTFTSMINSVFIYLFSNFILHLRTCIRIDIYFLGNFKFFCKRMNKWNNKKGDFQYFIKVHRTWIKRNLLKLIEWKHSTVFVFILFFYFNVFSKKEYKRRDLWRWI